MEWISDWVQGIIVAVIIVTIIEMILTNGNSKKYIKVVIGIYILFSIIVPIINKFNSTKFDINEILDLEKYANEISIQTSTDLENNNEEQIKNMYETGLKQDIKSKLNDKGYNISNMDIELEEEYKIKKITIRIKKNEKENENIKKVDKIEIRVIKEKEEEIKNITEKEIEELKDYINSTYEVKKENIIIEEDTNDA